MKPHLSKAAETLRAAINAHYPDRDKRSDGWIADARHVSAGKSDHIADASSGFIVRAIDIDRDLHGIPKPDEMPYLADQIRAAAKAGDRRISYLIFDGKIASSKKGWAWREYTGVNKHRHHLHCSFTSKGDKDSTPFKIPLLGANQ
jgi:hypothetical protein